MNVLLNADPDSRTSEITSGQRATGNTQGKTNQKDTNMRLVSNSIAT